MVFRLSQPSPSDGWQIIRSRNRYPPIGWNGLATMARQRTPLPIFMHFCINRALAT